MMGPGFAENMPISRGLFLAALLYGSLMFGSGLLIGLAVKDAPAPLTAEEQAAAPTWSDDYDQNVNDLKSACWNISRNSDAFDSDDEYFQLCRKVLRVQ